MLEAKTPPKWVHAPLWKILDLALLFADDTMLLNSAKNVNFLCYSLKHNMVLLTNWYKANQLSLNMNKTVLIKFWSNGKPFKIKVGDTEIKNIHYTKFLGVMVDECLDWKEHCNTNSKLLANKRLLMNAHNLLQLAY